MVGHKIDEIKLYKIFNMLPPDTPHRISLKTAYFRPDREFSKALSTDLSTGLHKARENLKQTT